MGEKIHIFLKEMDLSFPDIFQAKSNLRVCASRLFSLRQKLIN